MAGEVPGGGLLFFCLNGIDMAYKKMYFQKEGESEPVKESVSDFSIWCKEFPFKLFGDAKEPASNEWDDEHGADEYVGDTLFMEPYDMEVEFAYKGARDSANAKIKAFLNYLTGIDGTGVSLKIYDDFTKIGRRHVRYVSCEDDLTVRTDSEGDVMVFIVTFRVNDPITDITLSK